MLNCSQYLTGSPLTIRLKDDGLGVAHLHAEPRELLCAALPFACTGMHIVAFDSDSAT